MNIIISNRFSNQLKNLNIDVIKELNGEYDADQIASTMSNIYYDHIIFDITALKDNTNIENIQKLSATFDMSKVILFLDDNKQFLTQEFISSIISIGIYNFTKNIEGVKYLLEHPNSYGDVMKYHKVDASVIEATKKKEEEKVQEKGPRKYNSIEEIYASTELTPAEKDAMITKIRMQESVKKAKIGGEKSEYVRKKNTKFRYVLAFVILPIILISFTYGYHYFLYTMDSWIKPKSGSGKIIFKEIFEDGPTYATLIASILLMIFVLVANKIINSRIRSTRTSPLKYSLIPFGIVVTIVLFDMYFVHFLENLLVVDGLKIKPYMENNIYTNFKFVFYMETCLYYVQLIFNKAKKLEFESEVGQKITLPETLFAVILMLVIFLPACHELFNVFDYVAFISNIFNKIFEVDNIMVYLSILEFIGLAALITIEIIHKTELKQVTNSAETKKVI